MSYLFQLGYFFFTLISNLVIVASKIVLIIASIWVFLGVSIQSSNVFNVLPLGLSSAPYIFTKCVFSLIIRELKGQMQRNWAWFDFDLKQTIIIQIIIIQSFT